MSEDKVSRHGNIRNIRPNQNSPSAAENWRFKNAYKGEVAKAKRKKGVNVLLSGKVINIYTPLEMV